MKLCSLLTASKEFQLVLQSRDIKGVTVNTQRCKAIIPWLQEECRGSQNALVFSKPLLLAKNWNFHQLCCQGTYHANIHRTLELEKPFFLHECNEQMRKIWEAGWIFLDPHRIFGNGNNLNWLGHIRWEDSVSMLDHQLVRPGQVRGWSLITN